MLHSALGILMIGSVAGGMLIALYWICLLLHPVWFYSDEILCVIFVTTALGNTDEEEE